MNLILGNRTKLKQWLLPETWQEETQKDDVIDQLGLGVAMAFETHCNRKFFRTASETTLHPANERTLLLARYPLDAKPTAEMRGSGSDTFSSVSDQIVQWRADTGALIFSGEVGGEEDILRITATGGYWFDSTEDASGGSLPSNATALPTALQSAWLMQCRHLWTTLKMFANTGDTAAVQNSHLLGGFDLLPVVVQMLAPYRRFTI